MIILSQPRNWQAVELGHCLLSCLDVVPMCMCDSCSVLLLCYTVCKGEILFSLNKEHRHIIMFEVVELRDGSVVKNTG